jgi:hypothetical protein
MTLSSWLISNNWTFFFLELETLWSWWITLKHSWKLARERKYDRNCLIIWNKTITFTKDFQSNARSIRIERHYYVLLKTLRHNAQMTSAQNYDKYDCEIFRFFKWILIYNFSDTMLKCDLHKCISSCHQILDLFKILCKKNDDQKMQ